MANILRRPMFRLGGQSSDGVGITSGLNRRNYANGPSTDELMSQTYEAFQKSNKALENYGRPSKGEFALGLSDILRQGGSIYDMVTNAKDTVLPMYQDYRKKQAAIGPAKFQNLAAMTGLGIKRDQANKPLLPEVKTRMLVELSDWKQGKVDATGKWKNNDDYVEWQSRMNIIDSGFLTETEARLEASKIVTKLEAYEDAGRTKQAKMIQAWIDFLTGRSTSVSYAQGGRVGLQNSFPGTVEEASMAEQIQTPGGVEDITENEEVIAEGQEMGRPHDDPFVILRARLPQEITDDVVKLIAYNPDAFKDFAAIETQQDVINFNETYGVELVLPTEQV